MTLRTERIASTLREAIQKRFAKGFADPRLADLLLTVTRIEVTPDLRKADVLIAVTPEAKESLAIHGLQHASRHIRRAVSDEIALPKAPDLVFRIDAGHKNETEVFARLAKIAEERAEPPPNDTPDAPPDE